MICRICDDSASEVFTGTILGSVAVKYYRCPRCQFLFTDEPEWLAGPEVKAVSMLDTGILSRNLDVARFAAVLFRLFFDPAGRYVDYGGGYGIFTRLMRDHGFDFRWHDPYSENLFAKGFEFAAGTRASFEAVTAVEVLEHLPSPRDLFEFCFRGGLSDTLFATTVLYGSEVPPHDEWWYYSRDTGQHISFYNMNTLLYISRAYGVELHTNGDNLHLLTRKRIAPWAFRAVCRHVKRIYPRLKFRSKAPEDLITLQERLSSRVGRIDRRSNG